MFIQIRRSLARPLASLYLSRTLARFRYYNRHGMMVVCRDLWNRA